MQYIKRLWNNKAVRYPAAIAFGAGIGLAYYFAVGCPTGGCPITSNPWITSGFGAVIGLMMVADSPPPRSDR